MSLRSLTVGKDANDGGTVDDRGMTPGSVVEARYAAQTVMMKEMMRPTRRMTPTRIRFERSQGKETAASAAKRIAAISRVRMVPR